MRRKRGSVVVRSVGGGASRGVGWWRERYASWRTCTWKRRQAAAEGVCNVECHSVTRVWKVDVRVSREAGAGEVEGCIVVVRVVREREKGTDVEYDIHWG